MLNKPTTRADFDAAIDFLRRAESNGETVRFGMWGDGLGERVEGRQCHASSKALQIIDGAAVYSYYKWP